MAEREVTLHTRRNVLGMALGLIAAGCSSGAGPGVGVRAGGGGNGFPSANPWCWDSNNAQLLDNFGRLIMQERNPYCTQPGAPSPQCDANNSTTWPKELTDEATWKILTEFDFVQGPNWGFGVPGATVPVTKSMRIPYVIAQRRAKRKVPPPAGSPTGTPPVEIGRENLLVGYAPNTNNVAGAIPWGDPGRCSPASAGALGEFARFITANMRDDGPNTPPGNFVMPNWMTLGNAWPFLEDGGTRKEWRFRGATILVDYAFRIPIAAGAAGATTPTLQTGGWIYVGYEGGGAY